MLRFLAVLIGAVSLAAGGWIVGSIYPAPVVVTDKVKQEASGLLERAKIVPADIAKLRARLSRKDFNTVTDNAAEIAAGSGKAVIIERDSAEPPTKMYDEESNFGLPAPAPSTAKIAGGFEDVRACPKMTISNSPKIDAEGKLAGDTRTVDVNGVVLGVNPTRGGCLASGFGDRKGMTF